MRPCNGMEESAGSLKTQEFSDTCEGPNAAEARTKVTDCAQNCWMIGPMVAAVKRLLPPVSRWVAQPKVTVRVLPCG